MNNKTKKKSKKNNEQNVNENEYEYNSFLKMFEDNTYENAHDYVSYNPENIHRYNINTKVDNPDKLHNKAIEKIKKEMEKRKLMKNNNATFYEIYLSRNDEYAYRRFLRNKSIDDYKKYVKKLKEDSIYKPTEEDKLKEQLENGWDSNTSDVIPENKIFFKESFNRRKIDQIKNIYNANENTQNTINENTINENTSNENTSNENTSNELHNNNEKPHIIGDPKDDIEIVKALTPEMEIREKMFHINKEDYLRHVKKNDPKAYIRYLKRYNIIDMNKITDIENSLKESSPHRMKHLHSDYIKETIFENTWDKTPQENEEIYNKFKKYINDKHNQSALNTEYEEALSGLKKRGEKNKKKKTKKKQEKQNKTKQNKTKQKKQEKQEKQNKQKN